MEMGSNYPMISIVVVTRNNYHDLIKTLDSAIFQKYPMVEVVVVNGSPEQYYVPTTYYKNGVPLKEVNDEGRGIYRAMNIGIDNARGDLVVFMNAGDRFASGEVLKEAQSIFFDPDIDVLCGATIRYDPRNESYSMFWARRPETLPYGMIACHQSIYYRKKVLEKYPFREDKSICNDWKQMLDIWRAGKRIEVVQNVFSIFDTSGASSQRQLRQIVEKWKYARKIVPAYPDLNRRYISKLKRALINRFLSGIGRQ